MNFGKQVNFSHCMSQLLNSLIFFLHFLYLTTLGQTEQM